MTVVDSVDTVPEPLGQLSTLSPGVNKAVDSFKRLLNWKNRAAS